MHQERFAHSVYTIRRKVLTIAGASFHVFDERGGLVFFSRQRAFKLREDIRLYASEAMGEAILTFKARKIIDFGVTFDVFDPLAGETVGSIRRKGMKSLVRDEWLIFDAQEREVGLVQEDSGALAILRRLHEAMSIIAPQAHTITAGGLPVAQVSQNRNPFVRKNVLAVADAAAGEIDLRLLVATGILLAAIEGRQ